LAQTSGLNVRAVLGLRMAPVKHNCGVMQIIRCPAPNPQSSTAYGLAGMKKTGISTIFQFTTVFIGY